MVLWSSARVPSFRKAGQRLHTQMKYRNFDPETNRPITALELLQKLEGNAELEVDILDITDVITKKEESRTQEQAQTSAQKDRDITSRMLDRYSKIAKTINKKSIKRRQAGTAANSTRTGSSGRTQIAEFEEYLSSKYPQAGVDTQKKLSLVLTQRIKELLGSKE